MNTSFKPIREWSLYGYDHHFREDFHIYVNSCQDLPDPERFHKQWVYNNIINLQDRLVYDNTIDRQKELVLIFNNCLVQQKDHIKLNGYENRKIFEDFANELIDKYIFEYKKYYLKIEGMFSSGNDIIELKKQINQLKQENEKLLSINKNFESIDILREDVDDLQCDRDDLEEEIKTFTKYTLKIDDLEQKNTKLRSDNHELESLYYNLLNEINELKEHSRSLSDRVHELEIPSKQHPLILF